MIISLILIRPACLINTDSLRRSKIRLLLGFQGLSFCAVNTNVDDRFPKMAELSNILSNLTWLERFACFGFALLRSVIGWQNSCHFPNQWEARPNQFWLPRTRFPALGAGYKIKVINLANHNRHRQPNVPIKARREHSIRFKLWLVHCIAYVCYDWLE